MILLRWVSAVLVLRLSTEATSFELFPSARSWITSRSRAVSFGRRGGSLVDPCRPLSRKPASTMSLTRGVKNIRLSCSASTAETRSRAASDFSTNPRAPASSASRMTWSESVMVSTMTLHPGLCWVSCRVAARPLRFGIPTSRITTSGFNSLAFSTASRPSVASPQISQPSCDCRSVHRPRRTTSWSSAIRIRTFTASPPG